MRLRLVTAIAAVAITSLFSMGKADETPTVPDFSKGIPDTTLEKKEGDNGIDTFYLNTKLSSKDFFKALRSSLGPGWGKRTLKKEEMIHAASEGRSKNAEVTLTVFVHSKLPDITIRVMHFKHKETTKKVSAEIAVIRSKGTTVKSE